MGNESRGCHHVLFLVWLPPPKTAFLGRLKATRSIWNLVTQGELKKLAEIANEGSSPRSSGAVCLRTAKT